VKKSSVFEWLTREGRETVKDYERSGRPRSHRADENVEKLRNPVVLDRRLRIRAMSSKLNLDTETITCL
jgi:hypothetical protein